MHSLDLCSLLITGDIPIPTEKSIFSCLEMEKHLKIRFYFFFMTVIVLTFLLSLRSFLVSNFYCGS